MPEVDKYNEKQAIDITIGHGYKGEEFETKVWKERGYLKSNGTLKKLISKLDTIFESVLYEGTGKRRMYTLKSPRDMVLEREFNYSGTKPSKEDIAMKEIIFNSLQVFLSKTKKESNSDIYWCKIVGLPLLDREDFSNGYDVIKDQYYQKGLLYNPNAVVDNFIQRVRNRSRDVFKNSLKWLESEGKIKASKEYVTIDKKGNAQNISEESYRYLVNVLTLFLEDSGIKYAFYLQSLSSMYISNFMREIHKEVRSYLEDRFGIIKFYSSTSIEILNDTPYPLSSTEGALLEHFVKRLWKLIEHVNKKESYRKSDIVWKRFNLLNSHLLINSTYLGDFLNVELKYDFELEVENYLKDLAEISAMSKNDYGNILIEEIMESERKRENKKVTQTQTE